MMSSIPHFTIADVARDLKARAEDGRAYLDATDHLPDSGMEGLDSLVQTVFEAGYAQAIADFMTRLSEEIRAR